MGLQLRGKWMDLSYRMKSTCLGEIAETQDYIDLASSVEEAEEEASVGSFVNPTGIHTLPSS